MNQLAAPAAVADDALPPRGYVFGMVLFLATLTMLFGASMVGYVMIRLRLAFPPEASEITALPLGAMRPPLLLLGSTAIMLASSITVHWAVDAMRRGKVASARKGLLVTLLLAAAFIAVQAPALAKLLAMHRATDATWVYGFVFFLILLHALHVVGGLIPLVVITAKARRGAYDAEHDGPVRSLGYYWHFLDAVWVVMFSVFMVLG